MEQGTIAQSLEVSDLILDLIAHLSGQVLHFPALNLMDEAQYVIPNALSCIRVIIVLQLRPKFQMIYLTAKSKLLLL